MAWPWDRWWGSPGQNQAEGLCSSAAQLPLQLLPALLVPAAEHGRAGYGGKGETPTPFVKLIPDILPYARTLQRGPVRAQLIRAGIAPGMNWRKHNGSWYLRHRSELYLYRNAWFGSCFPPLPPVNCFKGAGGMCVIPCRRKQPQLIRVVSPSTRQKARTHAQFFLKPLLTPNSASTRSYQLTYQTD